MESGSMYANGDAISIAFSRDQIADLLEVVYCKNFGATKVVGPSARSVPVTYNGDERYYIAQSYSEAMPLMCAMEFARVLPVTEKLSIVKDPYQFLIPA
jgi:hypothetical protein